MKQYLKYWCSPSYPGDPSNDPPAKERVGCEASTETQIVVPCVILRRFYPTTSHLLLFPEPDEEKAFDLLAFREQLDGGRRLIYNITQNIFFLT